MKARVWAAPGIERLSSEDGLLGYTDFLRVYVANDLPPVDDQIVELHELCHVWLRHNERVKPFLRGLHPALWNIACDLEIAKHCYSDEIDRHMQLPTSMTHSGIKRSDAAKYPDCVYAEEFYETLCAESEKQKKQFSKMLGEMWEDLRDLDGSKDSHSDTQTPTQSPAELIEALAERLAERKASTQISQAQKHVDRQVRNLPSPTLASELDRHLGRYRITREASYRRPSRYNPGGGLLRKGNLLQARRPKVTIYVDRSGSFTPEKTAEAEERLRDLLGRYGASIECDTLEFSDECGHKIRRGGGTNYAAVHGEVGRSRPKIAVIITDDDGCEKLELIKETHVIIIPIGCPSTSVAKSWSGAVEVLR